MNIKTLAIPATLMAFGTLSTEAAAQATSQTYIILIPNNKIGMDY